MTALIRKLKRYVPSSAFVAVPLALVSLIIHLTSVASPAFADFFTDHVSSLVRQLTAKLTSVLPFSLAETAFISIPVVFLALIIFLPPYINRGSRYQIRAVTALLTALLFLYSAFVFSFGVNYRTSTLDKRLGIPREKVSAEELYATMTDVIENLNALSDDILLVKDKGSMRPYSHDDTVALCIDSYNVLAEKYPFITKLTAPVKQITLSDYMTYTHISGVYTFFTGEANVNTNYPYFVNVYTIAHEMAHQRGIARENEANFMAYLVCINSPDTYMRYSGYLNMYEYLASPLYQASPELYYAAAESLNTRSRYDLRCYSEFFDKYRESKAADVSDAVNNAYLKIQGTAEGTKSYGMVVDLAVAYHKNLRNQSN